MYKMLLGAIMVMIPILFVLGMIIYQIGFIPTISLVILVIIGFKMMDYGLDLFFSYSRND